VAHCKQYIIDKASRPDYTRPRPEPQRAKAEARGHEAEAEARFSGLEAEAFSRT